MNFFASCKREYENEQPIVFPLCHGFSRLFPAWHTCAGRTFFDAGGRKGQRKGTSLACGPNGGHILPKDGRLSDIFYPFHLLMFWASARGSSFFFGLEGCPGRTYAA